MAGGVTLSACAGAVQVRVIMSRRGRWVGFSLREGVLQSEAGGGASGRHGRLFFSSRCADFRRPESEESRC